MVSPGSSTRVSKTIQTSNIDIISITCLSICHIYYYGIKHSVQRLLELWEPAAIAALARAQPVVIATAISKICHTCVDFRDAIL